MGVFIPSTYNHFLPSSGKDGTGQLVSGPPSPVLFFHHLIYLRLMDFHPNYLFQIAMNIGRYFFLAGLPFLIFYILFPHKFSRQKIQKRFARQQDFIREVLHSMKTIVIFIAVAFIVLQSPVGRLSKIYTDVHAFSLWWIPLSALLGLVIQDTYFYWMHRAVHGKKLFKWVHLLHHKSTNPSPLASYSFNLLEGILEAMIFPVIILLVPMHPLALLLFTTVAFLFNVYGHLGYEIMPQWFRNSFLFEILNTSVHHNLHHEKFNGNYGLYFRFWDRIMGTENPDYVKTYDKVQQRRFGKHPARSAQRASLSILLLCAFAMTPATPVPSIEGKWQDSEGGGIIRIYEAEGKYYGELDSTLDPNEQQLIEGRNIIILKDFERKVEGEFCCGTIFAPRYRQSASGTLKLLDETTLEVTAEINWLMTRSRVWKRV